MTFLDHLTLDSYDSADWLRFNGSPAARPTAGRIAIVGLPGAGKKTLCNSLWGWNAVQTSEETTRSFGLLSLIDLPLDPYDVAGVLYRLEHADLIIFLLDGEQGLNADSFNWITRLRALDTSLLIALNKADRVPAERLKSVLEFLEGRVGRPVLALKALEPDDVRENLLLAVLKLCPELAVPLATEITALRPAVALHVIMQTALLSLSMSADVSARPDTSTLVGLQLRLIRQIAAIYGYKERANLRERIGLTMLLRTGLHLALRQAARLQKLDSRISAGMVSVAGTVLVGRAAMLIYGAQLPRWLLRFTPQAWRVAHASAANAKRQ